MRIKECLIFIYKVLELDKGVFYLNMKKAKLLFLAPALFSIVACGLGSEINYDKAKEVAAGIAKNAAVAKAYEAKIVVDETDEGAANKGTITLKVNVGGDFCYIQDVTSKEDGKETKQKSSMYKVADKDYDEVIYMSNWNEKEGKDDIEVYVKKDNEISYAIVAAALEVGTLAGEMYISSPASAPALVEAAEGAKKQYEEEADMKYEVKYYSKGDLNLSIKSTANGTEDGKKVSGTSVMTYDKGLMVSEEINEKFGDDKMIVKVDVKYSDSVKVSLPNGWKNYIAK